MSLTLSKGPLTAKTPPAANYAIDGPAHRLLWDHFPRRVRAEFAGETVLDTVRGRLLHESQILPVLYVPREDIRMELLEPSAHSTHCPFKGDAGYWSIKVGDRVAENAIWSYPRPEPDADWLLHHYAFYWDALDRWLDEDEVVKGHLRDPYHRVDVRRGSRAMEASVEGEVLASSTRPWVLSETGLPNRIYFPTADVNAELLRPSPTRTHCPYKGDASYVSYRGADGGEQADIGWSYEEPFSDAIRAAGAICFDGDGVAVRPLD